MLHGWCEIGLYARIHEVVELLAMLVLWVISLEAPRQYEITWFIGLSTSTWSLNTYPLSPVFGV